MRRVGASFGVTLIFLTACSSAHPVLYPNEHLKSVGKDTADRDIDDCTQLAKSAGAEAGTGTGGRVATNTAAGAGIGAASGAVWGLLSSLFYAATGPSQPNQAYTNFVNRCLQEKGYEVTGWQ